MTSEAATLDFTALHDNAAKPERKKARDVTRVQLDMPPKAMERLHALKTKTEASSYGEVVRNALKLYEAVVDELEQGNEFFLQQGQRGPMIPYKIFAEAKKSEAGPPASLDYNEGSF